MTAIVDSHQHFWNIDRFEYPWMARHTGLLRRNFLPEDLLPLLEDTGVERTILVQAQPKLALEETCWFLELAEEYDFIAGVVGWIDIADPGIETFLEMLAARPGLKGVRCLTPGDASADWQISDEAIRGLEVVCRHGLTYDLLFRPPHIDQIPVLARKLPDLKMVIDHIAKPRIRIGETDGWLEGMKAAAGFPNVFCKLSGLITQADWRNWKPDDLRPYVEAVVELFGFERLMFGSDWPFCLLAGSYREVYDALVEVLGPISDTERGMVFGGTAARFYGLE